MKRIALIGGTTLPTAYCRVNEAWSRGLRRAGYEVGADGDAEMLIHHDYSQHFATCVVGGRAERRVAVRTWDFGPFPRTWTARIGRDFDELWVHSRWIREKAIESGLSPDRVAVVPHGIDPAIFTPDGRAARDDRFTFLFVGATVARKGVDILLRAYAEAFAPDEQVQLILKGHSRDVFYQGQDMAEVIAAFQRDAGKPALRHIDAYLSDTELAAVYRSADAGVFPYRAEGFAIPILEAMACGLPCIVPQFGACLDYCTAANAFFVEPRRVRLPVGRRMTFNTLGFEEQVDAIDFCEVPVPVLAAALRDTFERGRDGCARVGQAASAAVREHWTWQHAIDGIVGLTGKSLARAL